MLKDRSIFWWRWLVLVCVAVMLFGLSMVVLPAPTRGFFGALLLSSPDAIDAFGPAAAAYVTLLHAVLGSVMFGWGTALLFVVLGPLRRGSYRAWLTLAVSMFAWFVPDTVFSLWAGSWQNAALNSGFALLFAIPLVATHRACRDGRS